MSQTSYEEYCLIMSVLRGKVYGKKGRGSRGVSGLKNSVPKNRIRVIQSERELKEDCRRKKKIVVLLFGVKRVTKQSQK